jgi:hypothetical protein
MSSQAKAPKSLKRDATDEGIAYCEDLHNGPCGEGECVANFYADGFREGFKSGWKAALNKSGRRRLAALERVAFQAKRLINEWDDTSKAMLEESLAELETLEYRHTTKGNRPDGA